MNEPLHRNILGIHTATKQLALGLMFGEDRLIKSAEFIRKSHGRFIIKKINELFQSAALKPADLNAIAICIGPGSFTGLRIGLAAAKGMAVALDIPIVPVTSFEIAAYQLRAADSPVHVLIPLNRDECIIGRTSEGRHDADQTGVVKYTDLARVIADEPVATYDADLDSHIVGLPNFNLSDKLQIDAADLLHLGREKYEKRDWSDTADLEPLYYQKSQAEIKHEQRQQRT